jgi:DNA polymerase-1
MKPIYLIDAMNYIHRSFHALPAITAPSGVRTNAVFGYLRTLLRIIKEAKPNYMAAAFEDGSSFRKAMFDGYKANRVAPPRELESQFQYCRKITKAIGVSCYELPDYEADDIIGTIAVRMAKLGYPVVVVTGDKDMSQLVSERICIFDLAKEAWLDEASVRLKFGVAPRQIPDLLALQGDHVDNIPGVMGVGEKTARHILSVCRSVEELAGSSLADSRLSFRGRDVILRRIRTNIDTVRLSRQLATICCEAPIEVTPERLRYRRADKRTLDPLCSELGLGSVLSDIPLAQPTLF